MQDLILQYVGEKGQVSAGELVDNLDIPRSSLFRMLDELVEQGQLVKIGSRPHVIYKLPSDSDSISDLPIPEPDSADTAPALPPNATAAVASPALLYWCKFLHLDPQAVTLSYKQIRELVPNAQSIGMSAPKEKKVGLKIPDPIWVKFFNLITWIVAIGWTILKNGWGLFRKFYKGEIPWGPIVVMCLIAWVTFVFILPRFVKPSQHENQTRLLELNHQASLSKSTLVLPLQEAKDLTVKLREELASEKQKYSEALNELLQAKNAVEKAKHRISDFESWLKSCQEDQMISKRVNDNLMDEGDSKYQQFQQEKMDLIQKLKESESKVRELSRE